VHRVGRVIRDKQKEQFELHRLREALGHRFFPKLVTPAATRCFDVEITGDGSRWRIAIPDLNDVTTTRHHISAEMTARQQIAFSTARSLGWPCGSWQTRVRGCVAAVGPRNLKSCGPPTTTNSLR
jgi:hypothetical protein